MYRGIPYPIEKSPKGYLRHGTDVEQLKSDMLQVLLTRPGERVMEPKFGTPLQRVNYQAPPQMWVEQLRQMVAKALKYQEPRVQVEDVRVEVDTNANRPAALTVVFVDPTRPYKTEELTIDVLEGGF